MRTRTFVLVAVCVVFVLACGSCALIATGTPVVISNWRSAIAPPASVIVDTPVENPIVVAPPVVAPPATNICPEQISAGQTVKVPDGCVVLGDVEAEGQIFYDEGGSGQATVIVIEGQSVEIFAEWGAGVEPLVEYNSVADLVKEYVADELVTGCGQETGCDEVRFVLFKNNTVILDEIRR